MSLAALHNLFLRIFEDNGKLRLHLSIAYPELAPSLPPEGVSREQYVFRTLEVLRSHGYLDVEFFHGLVAAYPRLFAAIVEAARPTIGAAADGLTRPPLAATVEPAERPGVERASVDVQKPVRVLFIAASPEDRAGLDLRGEAALVADMLTLGKANGKVAFNSAWDASADTLQTQMLAYQPTVLHVAGHGQPGGVLELMDRDTRRAQPISIRAFSRIVTPGKRTIWLVVLNSCYSAALAQELVLRGIDVVVGMTEAVVEATSHAFAESFYRGLAFGGSVQDAFDGALGIVEARGIKEADLPQLSCRPGVDPSARTLV
jgi:hypothetical protein